MIKIKNVGGGAMRLTERKAAKAAPKAAVVVMYKPLSTATISSRRRFSRLLRAVTMARHVH